MGDEVSFTTRKYSRVNGTYKFGCRKCTQLGHQEDTCSLILEINNNNNKNGKATRSERLSSADDSSKRNKTENA